MSHEKSVHIFYCCNRIGIHSSGNGVSIFAGIDTIHWNVNGEVDSYGHRSMIFLAPVLSLLVTSGLYYLPGIVPKGDNIQKIRQIIPRQDGYGEPADGGAARGNGNHCAWIANASKRYSAGVGGYPDVVRRKLLAKNQTELLLRGSPAVDAGERAGLDKNTSVRRLGLFRDWCCSSSERSPLPRLTSSFHSQDYSQAWL